jgi:hypothetical protein
MDPVTGTIVGATALAASAYLNARLSISTDLRQLRYDREWARRLGQRIGELGDTCTLFAMFDRVDEAVEGLWFEGRSWTYGELKRGKPLFIYLFSL